MHRKERANDTKQPSAQISAPRPEATPTLPQRIRESASGLLKETFERPSPRAVTGALASLNTDNAKVGSPSNSNSTGEPSSTFGSSSQHKQATLDQAISFRSNDKGGKSGTTYGQVAFDEFFGGVKELVHEPEFAVDGPELSDDQRSGFPMGTAENTFPRVHGRETRQIQDENQDFTDQNIDGAAVVALLSDPAFTVDKEPSSTLTLERDRGEGRNYGLLQTGKKPAKPVDALHPSNPLDMMPDFGASWNWSHASLATESGYYGREQFLESSFEDVQPWIDILGRYHDEVWGDMLPLVQEAREELKAANEDQIYLGDGPASRRLRMVLQHLDNPNNG